MKLLDHPYGHEFEHPLGDSQGERNLACSSPWNHRVRYDLVTEQQQRALLEETSGSQGMPVTKFFGKILFWFGLLPLAIPYICQW